jgi:hypothetical protein
MYVGGTYSLSGNDAQIGDLTSLVVDIEHESQEAITIKVLVDRDNDPEVPEVRIMVDNECIWSALGYE